MGLLRTLAIFIIVYYAFKFIGRFVMPLFVKKVVDNVEKKFQEKQQNQNQTKTGKVGETVIDKKPPVYKEGSKEVGDYVDFEEVKED